MSHRTSRRTLIAILTVALAAWWLWPDSEGESETTDGEFGILTNRVWIDHIPTNERDKVSVFVMLDDPAFGMFSESSSFEGDWAMFEWSLERGLVFNMLQAQRKHTVKPKLASGAACAPFDHCLKLAGAPRGPKKYGSMEDWIINGNPNLDARQLVTKILAEQN